MPLRSFYILPLNKLSIEEFPHAAVVVYLGVFSFLWTRERHLIHYTLRVDDFTMVLPFLDALYMDFKDGLKRCVVDVAGLCRQGEEASTAMKFNQNAVVNYLEALWSPPPPSRHRHPCSEGASWRPSWCCKSVLGLVVAPYRHRRDAVKPPPPVHLYVSLTLLHCNVLCDVPSFANHYWVHLKTESLRGGRACTRRPYFGDCGARLLWPSVCHHNPKSLDNTLPPWCQCQTWILWPWTVVRLCMHSINAHHRPSKYIDKAYCL